MPKDIDLRSIFAKVRLNNNDRPGIEEGPSFETTDIAYLRSEAEVKSATKEERRKSLSDFAISNNAWLQSSYKAENGKNACTVMLRSSHNTNLATVVNADGDLKGFSLIAKEMGIPVCLDIDSKSLISAMGKTQNIKFSSKKVGTKEKHFIELGAYPGRVASEDLQKALEEAYNHGYLKDGLTCTGLLYTTNGQMMSGVEFVSMQNPEFEYNGEKYVRAKVWNHDVDRYYQDGTNVPHRKHNIVWHKVEPVRLEIKNWEELPQSINPNGSGKSDIIKTETEECIISGLPYYPNWYHENCFLWQNSLVRAFLNSAKSSELDGNPDFESRLKWDFTNSGFLYQAFDMSREPIKEYTIPETETSIPSYAFEGCLGIEKIIIPSKTREVDKYAFQDCKNTQIVIENPNEYLRLDPLAFTGANIKFIYLSKDGNRVIFTQEEDPMLEQSCLRVEYEEDKLSKYLENNFRANFVNAMMWKESGKIKFIPPDYTLEIFPSTEFEKYFVNNNNARWAKLVKTLGFDTLQNEEKINSLTDLMKIYYAIGGFSENQGESERAYEYIVNYVAVVDEPNPTPKQIGDEIHSRFSKLQLRGPYNPEFAKFFMKYYKDDPNFMVFKLDSDYEEQDYLCSAHNCFAEIQKAYPNRVVSGNEERALLSPQFVAEHSYINKYKYVAKGNEELANLVGRYGYSQIQFNHIQDVYEKAKTLKDKFVISADKADEENGISFRVLEKDDPLGFVLGDITNCCQHVDGIGGSCVDDGYLNPEAGFLVFEESILDENGNPTGDKRILGQAYIWYDPETKTVCYDNIEIPTKILEELRKGDKNGERLSSSHLLDAVVKSAEKIMLAMNKMGFKVERVTTGKGYNDLTRELEKRFGAPERNPIAKHRNYTGYSDAKEAQFIIKDTKATYILGFTDSKISSANNNDGQEVDDAYDDIL